MTGQTTAVEDGPEVAATPIPAAADEVRDRAGLRPMLLALCFATFLVTGNGVAISPFLLDMARDLGTSLAAVANLVALSSITWGVASLFAGAASDRIGRKPILIGGLVVLILSPLGVALSQSYPAVAAWRTIGGVGGGAFMGAVFATVADRFPARERGRALAWLTTGQSLSLVIGVPILTNLGGVLGWRGAFTTYGIAMLLATCAVLVVIPGGSGQRSANPPRFLSVLRVLKPPTIALLLAGVTERLCYAAVSVFLPTYLVQSYGISLSTLAIGLACVASGNLAGSLIGGRLGDRFRVRAVVSAFSLAATGLLALPVLLWQPGVWLSVALCFAYTLANSIGRPALLSALSEAAGEARGAVLGLNITGASVGWLAATAIGGPLLIGAGFGGLGIFTAALAFVGALLATASWLGTRRANARG